MIVSDTSPIISLLKADSLWILEKIFGEIIIPEEVFRELTSDSRFFNEADIIKNSSFIKVKSVVNQRLVNEINTLLDRGESEAIVFAQELHTSLLIDEASGRKVAARYNLNITGTVGVLGYAYRKNLLTENQIRECQKKFTQAKRRIPDKLFEDILTVK